MNGVLTACCYDFARAVQGLRWATTAATATATATATASASATALLLATTATSTCFHHLWAPSPPPFASSASYSVLS